MDIGETNTFKYVVIPSKYMYHRMDYMELYISLHIW